MQRPVDGSGATDRLHASQVGISHRGQGAVDGRLRVCVCLCVPYLKLIWNDRYHHREHHCRRTATPRFWDDMVSLKSSCARRSTTHADRTHIYSCMQIKSTHQHKQIHLSSRLWILFFALLVSMSPNTCSGACAMHVPTLAQTRNLSHVI